MVFWEALTRNSEPEFILMIFPDDLFKEFYDCVLLYQDCSANKEYIVYYFAQDFSQIFFCVSS